MHVAAADRAEAEASRELLERAVLGVRVVAVDRLERVEPTFEVVVRDAAAVERPHRVRQRHRCPLAAHDRSQRVDRQQFRREALEAKDEHVTHIGADLHTRQQPHLVLLAEVAQLFLGPDRVVLGQHEAIEPSDAGLLGDCVDAHAAVARAWGGVGVQIEDGTALGADVCRVGQVLRVEEPSRVVRRVGHSVPGLAAAAQADQLGQHLEAVVDNAEVGVAEDRRLRVGVDGDEDARVGAARHVLRCARDARRDVDVRRHDRAGEPHLLLGRCPAVIDDRTRRAG